jgi:SOS response regulatory protein OraA/RecX
MKEVRLSEEELVALWQEEKENLRENPLKDAFEVAVKKWGWEEGTSIDRKTVVKVMQYLLRRGFVYSEINEMIESWRRNRV